MGSPLKGMLHVVIVLGLTTSCKDSQVIFGDAEGGNPSYQDIISENRELCTQISSATTRQTANDFDGVDILVVVDNSSDLGEAQALLSSNMTALVDRLTQEISDDPEWPYPSVDNVRLAVVTSDMGLQYGERPGQVVSPTVPVSGCSERGDNGAFQTTSNPPDAACQLAADKWLETTADAPNTALATEAACLVQQGGDGCSVGQPLEAAVRALHNNADFMHPTHLLAVVVVSGEDDCSIEDAGLFDTSEWLSGNGPEGLLNVACNYPASNEQYLFETRRYYDQLVRLKSDQSAAVIFAAIVGVPTGDNSPCQGAGNMLDNCLNATEMQLTIGTFADADTGETYQHFDPACTREAGGADVTAARPGRRYVDVAQQFGQRGYVSSLCNADWTPAMTNIAEMVTRQITHTCYPKQLDWSPLSEDEQDALECEGCGIAECEVVLEIVRTGNSLNDESCPAELYETLTESERAQYLDKKHVETETSGGVVTQKTIMCPIPKIPTPLDCDAADQRIDSASPDQQGWYYCETEQDGEPCTRIDLALETKRVSTGNFVSVMCLRENELSTETCDATDASYLGAECTQPGYELNPDLANTSFELSFQQNCDCMSFTKVVSFRDDIPLEERLIDSHFCTQPCRDTPCPNGFQCIEAFHRAVVDDELNRSYCVPDCLIDGCTAFKQVDGEDVFQECLPSGGSSGIWSCQFPPDIDITPDAGV